jgi:hypothetical protein
VVEPRVRRGIPLTSLADSGPTSSCTTLQVDVYQGSNHVASGAVPVNKLGTLLPLNLSALAPQQASYGLSCTATLGASNQTTFATNASLLYLPPNPYGGNTVKVDRRSGALLVRNETAGAKAWEKLIPFGFYDVGDARSDFFWLLLSRVPSPQSRRWVACAMCRDLLTMFL